MRQPPIRGSNLFVMLLQFQGIAADRGQIRHRLGTVKIGAPEMLRCAKDLGLKARAYRTDWSRLVRTPLPAIASLRDGGFHAHRQGLQRQGAGAVATGAKAGLDVARGAQCGLGPRPDPDDAPGRTSGSRPPVRRHLVSRRDPEVPASPVRSADRVVLPADVRPGLTAVLPGGDRQSPGTPGSEHPRRVDCRAAGDLDF